MISHQVGNQSFSFHPITNRSINSQAGVLFEIRKREQECWFSGLRTAELFIDEKQHALVLFHQHKRKAERRINKKQRRFDDLSDKPNLSIDELEALEALQDEITGHRYEFDRIEAEVRDALMELNTAKAERERILREHPEALELNYQELQEIFTPIMLQERQARYVAARLSGLPEQVAEVLLDLPEGTRQQVLDRAVALSEDLRSLQVSIDFASLPEEEKRELLGIAFAETEAQTQLPENLPENLEDSEDEECIERG